MGAIGLVEGELGMTSTRYAGLRSLEFPAQARSRIVHVTSLSTYFPTKELGYVPSTLAGTMLITAASVDEFISAVLTGSAERKISFMWGGVEHYVKAYSGDITSLTCINPYGTATRLYEIGFSFPLSRSQVYVGSSDAVLWGS